MTGARRPGAMPGDGLPECPGLTYQEQIDFAWQCNSRTRRRVMGCFRTRLAEAQNWRCCYCGTRMHGEAFLREPTAPTLEHVTPRSKGGTDHYDNLVVACLRCNEARGDRRIRGYDHA